MPGAADFVTGYPLLSALLWPEALEALRQAPNLQACASAADSGRAGTWKPGSSLLRCSATVCRTRQSRHPRGLCSMAAQSDGAYVHQHAGLSLRRNELLRGASGQVDAGRVVLARVNRLCVSPR